MTTQTSFASSPGSDGYPQPGSLQRRGTGRVAHLLDPGVPLDGGAAPTRMCLHRPITRNSHDLSPSEILIIPARSRGSLFSVAFLSV